MRFVALNRQTDTHNKFEVSLAWLISIINFLQVCVTYTHLHASRFLITLPFIAIADIAPIKYGKGVPNPYSRMSILCSLPVWPSSGTQFGLQKKVRNNMLPKSWLRLFVVFMCSCTYSTEAVSDRPRPPDSSPASNEPLKWLTLLFRISYNLSSNLGLEIG
jgi:hypothetical protein